jgi:hypothetical protein
VNNLPSYPIGENAQVEWMRKVRQMIRENSPLPTDAYGLDRTSLGWRLRIPKSKGGTGSNLQRMIVKGIDTDWFYCLAYDKNGQSPAGTPNWQDGVTPQTDYILVAKPWELRFSPWDGQTIDGLHFSYADATYDYARRKVTQVSGSGSEIQIVVRPWYIGEIILAATNITGGTDQEDDGPNNDGVPPLATLVWEDVNQTAHAWAQTDIPDPIDASL